VGKRIKKFLLFGLMLVLVISIAACGEKTEKSGENILNESVNAMLTLPAYRMSLKTKTDMFSDDPQTLSKFDIDVRHQPTTVYILGTMTVFGGGEFPVEMYWEGNKIYTYQQDPQSPGRYVWTVETQEENNTGIPGGNPDEILTQLINSVVSVERLPDEKSQPLKNEEDLIVLKCTLDPAKMQDTQGDSISQLESITYTVKIWKDNMKIYKIEGEQKGKVTPTGQETREMTMFLNMEFRDAEDIEAYALPDDVKITGVWSL